MKRGDQAPDFELPDETGKLRKLSTLLGDGHVVLFFYPIALSSGCTAQACHFRDLAEEFAKLAAQRIGISTDTVAAQREFAETKSLGYPLLSDSGGGVAQAYGVKRKLLAKLTPVKRATFVIGSDGIIRDVIASEMNMRVHADKALATLASF